MKSILQLTIAVACLQAACVAHAAPLVWYYPETGFIQMRNDTGAPLALFGMVSTNNNIKIDSSMFKVIDGPTFDPGDLPFAFTYISFPDTSAYPEGRINIGKVINPHTPVGDLSAVFFRSFVNPVREEAGINEPEPTTGVLAAIAATAFVGFGRRFHRKVT
ncbi:MAG: hypothetical protein C0485_11395 [Pirellula sp.]|nr:hypothetical protein [Pirellula sp.]